MVNKFSSFGERSNLLMYVVWNKFLNFHFVASLYAD